MRKLILWLILFALALPSCAPAQPPTLTVTASPLAPDTPTPAPTDGGELPVPPDDQRQNPLWAVRYKSGYDAAKDTLVLEDQKMLIEAGGDYVVFSGHIGDPIVNDFKDLIAQSGATMRIGRYALGSYPGKENDPEWQPYLLHCDGNPVHMTGGTAAYAFDFGRTVNGVSYTEKFIEELLGELSGLQYDDIAELDYVYLNQQTYFNMKKGGGFFYPCGKDWFDEYEKNGKADNDSWRAVTDSFLSAIREALAARPEGPILIMPNNALSASNISYLERRLDVSDGVNHQWLGLGNGVAEPPKEFDPAFMEGVLGMIDNVVASKKYAFVECNPGTPSIPGRYTSPVPPTEGTVTYCVGIFHLIRDDTYTYLEFSPPITDLSLQMVKDWQHIVNGNYGYPIGPRRDLGNHVWEREFSNGKWVVDLGNHEARFERR